MSNSREKWNAKYSERSSFSSEPDPFLVEHVHLLKPGSVLDFACGTGRNSIWLAGQGFKVIGTDISDVGLNHLETTAKSEQHTVETILMDLSDKNELNSLTTYDNIVINMYKPSHEVLLNLPEHLSEGGVLLMCTHNWKQVEAGKFKMKFALGVNELTDLEWNMQLIHHSSFEHNSGFYDGYIFRRQ